MQIRLCWTFFQTNTLGEQLLKKLRVLSGVLFLSFVWTEKTHLFIDDGRKLKGDELKILVSYAHIIRVINSQLTAILNLEIKSYVGYAYVSRAIYPKLTVILNLETANEESC